MNVLKILRIKFCTSVLASLLLSTASPVWAMSLQQAITSALHDNPEILEAISNREGVEFELEQALGLKRPRVDFEAVLGGEIRDSASTRAAGTSDQLFLRKQASVVVRQTLYDGDGTRSEVEH